MEKEITGSKFWEGKPNCIRLQDFCLFSSQNYRSCLDEGDTRALPDTGRECLWDNWMLRGSSFTETAAVGCNSNESHIEDECALFITLIAVTYPIMSPIMM